jgi:PAS domain S-box-containing protein
VEATNQTLNEEIQVRARMEETLQQLASIVEFSDDAILATDPDGLILTWNPGAERLYGFTRDEVLGKHISLLHARKELERDLIEKLGNGDRVNHVETVKLTKDGREIDVSLTISTILDRKGRIIGASRISRDITERKQLDRMKDEFVGTVSHELRTPLTAIKGFIELVLDGDAGPVADTQREFLEVAARNADRLGSVINDILDVSRIESQGLEIRLEPTDLAAVLEDVASTFRLMAHSKGLALRHEVADVPKVLGDAPRLVQVFSNLLSNAIKYTPSGEIGITAGITDNRVDVVVHDTGIGLTPEEQSQLFTKFFRGRHPVVTDSGGTGLGLVIAKAIIEKHQGTIDVDSRPGEGTRFRVTLPVASAAAEPAA